MKTFSQTTAVHNYPLTPITKAENTLLENVTKMRQIEIAEYAVGFSVDTEKHVFQLRFIFCELNLTRHKYSYSSLNKNLRPETVKVVFELNNRRLMKTIIRTKFMYQFNESSERFIS